MTTRAYLLFTAIVALIGWVGFGLVIFKLDPCTAPGTVSLCYSASGISLLLFFFSAFFACTASFTLIGFGLRFWMHRSELYLDHLHVSFRQAILLTFCTLSAMALLLLNTLTWWSGFLLIAIIVMLEFYFTRHA